MADTGRTVWADGFWADDFWAAGFWATGDAPVTTPFSMRTVKIPAREYRVRIEGDDRDL